MDYSPLLKPIQLLWWLIPVAVVLTVLKSAWFRGWVGESLVRLVSRIRLPAGTYHSLHNVTLPTPDGTTQIDHVVVSRFGIFVIETKHMKGWIFGSEHDAQWTQSIFGKSFRFQNPLRQNYKHVVAIGAAVDVSLEVVHSIVVFSGEAVFKSDLPANVVRGGRYVGLIKSFNYQIFSESQVVEFLGRLQSTRLPQTYATRRQHIRNLQTRRDPSADRNCPRCGSRMVIRTARAGRNAGGQFWGCSSFPRCKAVQSLS